MKDLKTGLIIIVSAMVFAHAETYYFGNNALPESWGEVVCDAIAVIAYAIGIYKVIRFVRTR